MNWNPGTDGACLVSPHRRHRTLGDQNAGHRRQARKAQSAIGGIVRKIIQVTRVIVVLLIAWQFPGSL